MDQLSHHLKYQTTNKQFKAKEIQQNHPDPEPERLDPGDNDSVSREKFGRWLVAVHLSYRHGGRIERTACCDAYFGRDFEPQDNELHRARGLFLSTKATAVRLQFLRELSEYEFAKKPYRETGELLVNEPAVCELVALIQRIQSVSNEPQFVVLESSRGSGKTEMAFNLMARDDLQCFYVFCDQSIDCHFRPSVANAFRIVTAAFLHCVFLDMKYAIQLGALEEPVKKALEFMLE